jgi:hypothetical protein
VSALTFEVFEDERGTRWRLRHDDGKSSPTAARGTPTSGTVSPVSTGSNGTPPGRR